MKDVKKKTKKNPHIFILASFTAIVSIASNSTVVIKDFPLSAIMETEHNALTTH